MLFAILTITLFDGCSKCEPKIEYIDREIEVFIPQKCTIPKIKCSWSGTNSETIVGMYECIQLQKESMKVCNGN